VADEAAAPLAPNRSAISELRGTAVASPSKALRRLAIVGRVGPVGGRVHALRGARRGAAWGKGAVLTQQIGTHEMQRGRPGIGMLAL